MPKKLLVVTSSVRSSRAADNVLSQINERLKNYNFDVRIADLRDLQLPIFDSPVIPSDESYSPTDKNVQSWTKMIDEADVVLLLTAEYNHSYTAAIKNAIDWIYKEWENKPIAFVGYGWAGGARAIKHLRDVFASNIGAKPYDTEANLRFMKEINLDGTSLDNSAAEHIDAVLKQI